MKKYVLNPKPPFQLFREKNGNYEPIVSKNGDSDFWVCGE